LAAQAVPVSRESRTLARRPLSSRFTRGRLLSDFSAAVTLTTWRELKARRNQAGAME